MASAEDADEVEKRRWEKCEGAVCGRRSMDTHVPKDLGQQREDRQWKVVQEQRLRPMVARHERECRFQGK